MSYRVFACLLRSASVRAVSGETMSYKIDLSTLQRDGEVSLTQQLVERFATAIDSGVLEPGEKLPPTRDLAAQVGVNHLTAARVYRKLAELGYVTASVGRGTFVRSLAPAGSSEYGDDWQVYALPQRELTYPEQVLADSFASAGESGLISLAVGWPSPRLFPTEQIARITAEVFEEEGGAWAVPPRGVRPPRHEVKVVALQTACQNPTGRHLSEDRRRRLAELAVERNFFLLEDSVYADAHFEGDPVRPLRELAPAHVIYVNSLSKVVGGGLRAGWVAARGPVRDRIAMLKLEDDFHTPTLIQHIAARWLAAGAHDRHIAATLPFYRERRDALLAALERHLAGEYRADPPRGGHHVWVTLTRPLDERALYSEATRHGVSFTPGGAVTAERRSQTALRLSFSLLDPEELDEGVRRLARAIREVRRRARRPVATPMS